MPSPTPLEAELAVLNREIERLETEQSLLDDLRKKRAGSLRLATWRNRYLGAAKRLRQPAKKWNWWRHAILLIGPAAIGIMLFVLIELVTGLTSFAGWTFLIVLACGLALFAMLLYRPNDGQLPIAIDAAEASGRVAEAHWKETFERQAEVREQLKRLVEVRRDRMASGRVQRAALLQRPWKTMSAVEWEDFVVEVCRTHGATADRRSNGDAGAELVLELGSRRVAALVNTNQEPLDSTSVHLALALLRRESCESCAIITNGRFTGAAQDFASQNSCRLIGRDEFPAFVMGAISLF